MTMLRLDRPLVIFDLETTGINVKECKIVEIAAAKMFTDGTLEHFTSLINPGMPIPEGVSRVHGIYNEDVADAPTFADLSEELFEFFYNCDYAGYNLVKFDIPVLQREFDSCAVPLNMEAGHIIDVMRIFKHFEKHRLADAVRFYCGHEIEDAHEAMADVVATLDVLEAQVARYELPRNARELSQGLKPPGAIDAEGKIREVDGVPTIMFGKHRNTPLNAVPKSYIVWLKNEDVVPEANHLFEEILRPKKGKQGGKRK